MTENKSDVPLMEPAIALFVKLPEIAVSFLCFLPLERWEGSLTKTLPARNQRSFTTLGMTRGRDCNSRQAVCGSEVKLSRENVRS